MTNNLYMTDPLYIFDLDGTLANIDHRRSLLDDKTDPDRWEKFYKACVNDTPNQPIVNILNKLGRIEEIDIWVWSGRSSIVRKETIEWLNKTCCLTLFDLWNDGEDKILRMRDDGDFTPDEELKKRWYEELSDYDKNRLQIIFDDRDKVVNMWRSLGLCCLQVADGDF